METLILISKLIAFPILLKIFVGYIAKALNSEPLADKKYGKMGWFIDVAILAACFALTLFVQLDYAAGAAMELLDIYRQK